MATSSRAEPAVWDPSENRVPVEIVQRMFYDTGMSMNAACIQLGWTRTHDRTEHYERKDGSVGASDRTPYVSGDTTRLARTLGLAHSMYKGVPQWRTHVNYETAVMLCRAWGRDPVDYGI